MAGKVSTHYATLGVPVTASGTDIKNAYRVLARKLHPDVASGTEAQFRAVSEAYEVLGNPARRAAYDLQIAPPAEAAPVPPRQSVFTPYASRPGYQPGAYRPGAAQQQTSRASVFTPAGGTVPQPGPARSSWLHSVFGTGQPGPGRRGYSAMPAGARLGRWAFPVTALVLLAAAQSQLSGLTGWLFHAKPGTALAVGHWQHAPRLGEGMLPAAPGAYLALLAVAALLTAGYGWRKTLAPTPAAEPVALLAALFVLTFAGQFLLVPTAAKLTVAALVAGYALWLHVLRRLPRPANTDQWDSFGLWMRGVAAYYKTRRAGTRAAAR